MENNSKWLLEKARNSNNQNPSANEKLKLNNLSNTHIFLGSGQKAHFTIIALIPLILSIGIAPALSIENFIQEADASKAVGPKGAKSYGSKNTEVCGDRLCSEFEPTPQASSSSRVTPSTPVPKVSVEEIDDKMMEEEPMKEIPMAVPTALAQKMDKPNIIVIMGDDIGWFNIGAYHRGIMAQTTPNIDKVAKNGMIFTDYYAEPSCTAGRASFMLGQLPIRTGLTTVGQAGVDHGIPDTAPTIATILKSMGYSTGQFGKNHFGDLNKYLPTVHGFDEFWGWLYHLDAMEDPHQRTYPKELTAIIGPRNMVHSWASDVDDPTEDKRWGKVGKQIIEDAGELPPKRMETVDKEVLEHTINFMDKAQEDGKPFFVWMNPSRVHVNTHLSEHYDSLRTPENGWSIAEAAHKEFDDSVGAILEYLEANGLLENTIVIVTTDNGAENWTWPDGGQTPFAAGKADVMEGGVRIPTIIHWPGHFPAGAVENGLVSHQDMLPTLVAIAGNPNIVDELKAGKTIGGKTYKVHLDGYNQLPLFTGQGESERHVIYYFMGPTFGALRVDDYKYRFVDRPDGPFGHTEKLAFPSITNLRLDPFERTGVVTEGRDGSFLAMDWFKNEFWRFVLAHQETENLLETFVEFPPLQGTGQHSVKETLEHLREAQHMGQ